MLNDPFGVDKVPELKTVKKAMFVPKILILTYGTKFECLVKNEVLCYGSL